MNRTVSLTVDGTKVVLPIIPSNAELVKINGYYAVSKGRLVRRVIVDKPDGIKPIIQYALTLQREYGKNVDLKLVTHKRGTFLRFKREDGIAIYVHTTTRDVYVRRADMRNEVFAKAIGYFLYACGYKLKEKTVMRL